MEERRDESASIGQEALPGARHTDRARRRAIIRAAVERSHQELLRKIPEYEAAIRAAEAKRGVLERLIGYRTRVPGI